MRFRQACLLLRTSGENIYGEENAISIRSGSAEAAAAFDLCVLILGMCARRLSCPAERTG